MGRIKLVAPEHKKLNSVHVSLEYSKSESNRLLIIRQLCQEKFEIKRLSQSDDTRIMLDVLNKHTHENLTNGTMNFNLGHSGTAMRFLCAYFSITEGVYLLNGSERMNERPIGPLVKALRNLGAEIEYIGRDGYPPLLINGKKINGGDLEIDSEMSSQFISALMLIAPVLKGGLNLYLKGKTVSSSYFQMTAGLMREFGIDVIINDNEINISPGNYNLPGFSEYSVEADWSAASYFYSLATISRRSDFFLQGLNKNSYQPDSVCVDLFRQFGVQTDFLNGGVKISSISDSVPEFFSYDFTNCPDLVQTFSIICSGLRVPARFTGLSTLSIKETDRVKALMVELKKFNIDLEILDKNTFLLHPDNPDFSKNEIVIKTYNDHRMAMCFTPMSLLYPNIYIENPSVVSKSFPGFWNEILKIGIKLEND